MDVHVAPRRSIQCHISVLKIIGRFSAGNAECYCFPRQWHNNWIPIAPNIDISTCKSTIEIQSRAIAFHIMREREFLSYASAYTAWAWAAKGAWVLEHMDIHGNPRKSTHIHKNVWIYMDIHRQKWKYMYIYRYPSMPMQINEYAWTWMEIHRLMEIRGFRRYPWKERTAEIFGCGLSYISVYIAWARVSKGAWNSCDH